MEGTITLSELQSKTTLDSTNLTRLLRHAMTNHILQEPTPGTIAHTPASRLLATDAPLQSWVGFNTEDLYPASAHVINALRTHPEATSPVRTGFNFAFGTVDTEPMFATLGRDMARARRMGQAMSSLTAGEGCETSHLVSHCDLADVDAAGGATFVDVGGSHGFVCADLARRWRNVRFVVQDLPATVASAPAPDVLCGGDSDEARQAAERIAFMAHDFFTEQPVRGAAVYFFRWIMHNHSTPYAVRILRNLIPALEPGARIIINDICLREPGTEQPWDERLSK